MGGATGGMATMTAEQMTAMMDGMMSQMEANRKGLGLRGLGLRVPLLPIKPRQSQPRTP